MPERFPSKPVAVDDYEFQLHGVSPDDAYWQSVGDNFEPEFQRFCRRLIQPDYVCLDIGANIGVKSLFLSRHCPQGRVIALEAGKSVAECLAVNITANNCANAVSHHAAAAGHDGTLRFDENFAWGHQGSGNGIEVEAVTLETLAARHEFKRLDFIKLDVEGGEFPVLKSSIDLINRFETLLHVELNSLTLLVWGKTNAFDFLLWIGANFSHVYALNRADPAGDLLTPVMTTDECRAILHRNLVDDGCVTDLVMSNAAHRFTPALSYMEDQLRTRAASLSQVREELAQTRATLSETQEQLSRMHAEREQAQAQLAHFASSSQLFRSQADAQLAEAQDALKGAEAAARLLEADRDALLRSSSWRVSAPLRWVKDRAATDIFTRRPTPS